MMVMVSSNSFVTIFIGLEVMSLSIYILCGLMKGSLRAVESSLKYFLLGSFGTAFFLYGIALIYASAGAIDIQAVRAVAIGKQLGGSAIFLAGMALLIVGFGFKIASVPFHMWTPDVYEGAPTSVTVFMATGVKAAAFGAFLRVFYTAFYPLHHRVVERALVHGRPHHVRRQHHGPRAEQHEAPPRLFEHRPRGLYPHRLRHGRQAALIEPSSTTCSPTRS